MLTNNNFNDLNFNSSKIKYLYNQVALFCNHLDLELVFKVIINLDMNWDFILMKRACTNLNLEFQIKDLDLDFTQTSRDSDLNSINKDFRVTWTHVRARHCCVSLMMLR